MRKPAKAKRKKKLLKPAPKNPGLDIILDEMGVVAETVEEKPERRTKIVDEPIEKKPRKNQEILDRQGQRIKLECPVCGNLFWRFETQTHFGRLSSGHMTCCSMECKGEISREIPWEAIPKLIDEYDRLPESASGIRKRRGALRDLANKYGVSNAVITNYVRRYRGKINE